MREITAEEATRFLESSTFVWHQQFELAPGVPSPGVNPISYLFEHSLVPVDLTGLDVLDIGTTNGAAAFECERRGAARVVAVDIVDADWFGFAALRSLFGSSVEFVRSSLYQLADVLTEQFDVVIFWGVLYHLRHPLLGLDAVRRLARGIVSLETAIANGSGHPADQPVSRFHRLDDLGGDGTNWWTPTGRALADWVVSAGFEVARTTFSDVEHRAGRVLMELRVVPGEPEYLRVSYERPVHVVVQRER